MHNRCDFKSAKADNHRPDDADYDVFAYAALGNLAAQQQGVTAACRSYAVVVDQAGRHRPQ